MHLNSTRWGISGTSCASKRFHNRVFDSLDAREDHLEVALKDFEWDTQRIQSIVACPWIIDVFLMWKWNEGLAALSMREVARRSGVTHQAPYHHFADRETILAELVTRGFRELSQRLARANERHVEGDPVVVALESGQAYVGFATDHPGMFRIMFRSEVCDPARFSLARQAEEAAYRELERLVALIHGEREVARLSPVYWGQVHGLASLIVDGPVGQQLPGVDERRAFMRDALTQFMRFMLGIPLPG